MLEAETGDLSLPCMSEGNDPADEVAKVVQELIVGLGSQISPLEHRVGLLRPVCQQVISPHLQSSGQLASRTTDRQAHSSNGQVAHPTR